MEAMFKAEMKKMVESQKQEQFKFILGNKPTDLEKFKVGDIPSIFYLPEWVTEGIV